MTSTSGNSPTPDLRAVVTYAETEAQRLLETAHTAPLDVVVWLSAHVAALEHAVYPVAKRALPDGQRLVAQQREIIGRLTKTLRVMERRHSGDVLASGLNADRMVDELRQQVEEHMAAEATIVAGLIESLSDTAKTALIASYAAALEHAPTRPHPHLHRGSLIFRLDALRDHILDAMDGRHVPLPRVVKEHVTPGRWGSYLLGQPHDINHEAG